MSLEIYTEGYANRKELAHAISVQMTWYYNEIGKLTVVADADDYNIAALADGNMLYDTEHDITFDICNVKCDTKQNRITANGYTTNRRLNRRCIASAFTLRNLESGVYNLVNANLRGLPRIKTAPVTGLTEQTDGFLYGGQLLDEVMPYLEEAGLGQKMVWDPDSMMLVFHVYKGADLTAGIHAAVFSEEQGTAKDMELAKIRVSSVHAVPICLKEIPRGIIGATVRFEYADPLWEGLRKTVVFRGCVTKDVLNTGEVVTIPPEVVAKAGQHLYVGVYGTDADENQAIPTLWADLGKIRAAADPSGDESTDESLPVWAQLQEQIDEIKETGTGGGGLTIDSDGEGNVSIATSGGTVITSDGAGNVTIG